MAESGQILATKILGMKKIVKVQKSAVFVKSESICVGACHLMSNDTKCHRF